MSFRRHLISIILMLWIRRGRDYDEYMEAKDPVNDVLKKLKATTPEELHPLLDAYEDSGIAGMGDAWRDIIREIANADS